jgi:hypothetical protein
MRGTKMKKPASVYEVGSCGTKRICQPHPSVIGDVVVVVGSGRTQYDIWIIMHSTYIIGGAKSNEVPWRFLILLKEPQTKRNTEDTEKAESHRGRSGFFGG